MSNFNYNSDKVNRRGFIDKKTILEYVSEEDIFQLVFGFQPKEYEYITSPFRGDSSPGCWFERDDRGILRFWDFGNSGRYRNIRLRSMDCFNAVTVFFNLTNFYSTLKFIHDVLIKGKELEKRPIKIVVRDSEGKLPVEIKTTSRMFDSRDAKYWSRYNISSKNLIEDNVFAVKKFSMLNTRKGDIVARPNDICYVYTEFLDDRKKLYFPKRKGTGRFLTNCKSNDIGGLRTLVPYGRKLIITKSYKDCRVLKNVGANAIWFQNEGMIPDLKILINICNRFDETTVWFDNDGPGIKALKEVYTTIQKFLPERVIKGFHLPEQMYTEMGIKDPADLVFREGEENLRRILNTKL